MGNQMPRAVAPLQVRRESPRRYHAEIWTLLVRRDEVSQSTGNSEPQRLGFRHRQKSGARFPRAPSRSIGKV